MKFQEIKTNSLYLITGILIGLFIWIVCDKMERRVHNQQVKSFISSYERDEFMEDFSSPYLTEEILEPVTIYDLQGNPVSIKPSGDRIIFINLWATRNPASLEELPSISRLHAKMQDRVDFYLISPESSEQIIRFKERNRLDLPFFRYNKAAPLPAFLQSLNIPYSVIIYKGKVRFEHYGIAPWDSQKVIRFMDKLMNEEKQNITGQIPHRRAFTTNIITII